MKSALFVKYSVFVDFLEYKYLYLYSNTLQKSCIHV